MASAGKQSPNLTNHINQSKPALFETGGDRLYQVLFRLVQHGLPARRATLRL